MSRRVGLAAVTSIFAWLEDALVDIRVANSTGVTRLARARVFPDRDIFVRVGVSTQSGIFAREAQAFVHVHVALSAKLRTAQGIVAARQRKRRRFYPPGCAHAISPATRAQTRVGIQTGGRSGALRPVLARFAGTFVHIRAVIDSSRPSVTPAACTADGSISPTRTRGSRVTSCMLLRGAGCWLLVACGVAPALTDAIACFVLLVTLQLKCTIAIPRGALTTLAGPVACTPMIARPTRANVYPRSAVHSLKTGGAGALILARRQAHALFARRSI